MIRIFILSFVLALSGCSSIPVSTMLKMSSMDESSLGEMHPDQLRARMTLEPGVRPDLIKTTLGLELYTEQGNLNFNFPLVMVSEDPVSVERGWFEDDMQMTAFTMRLSEQGISDFLDMQEKYASRQTEGLGLDIHVGLDKAEDHKTGIVTLELKLSDDEEFFTLIDQYEYTIGEKHDF